MSKENKKPSTRPELDDDSVWILQTFMKQRLFGSQKEVIRAALEALYQIQQEKEAKDWDANSQTELDFINSQTGM